MLARSGNMDLLVAIGTTAGWALSVWLWLTGPGGRHGRTCTSRARPWSSPWCCWASGWRPAPSARPPPPSAPCTRCARTVAHLLGRHGEVDLPMAEVMVGDRLVVRPGEALPGGRNAAGGRPGG